MIPARALEGKRAEDAIALLEPEANNPHAGEDARVVAEMKAMADEREAQVRLAKRLEAFRANLKDKAVNMLLTKDLASVADRRVVLQNLAQLARKEKAYELMPSPGSYIMDVFAEAVKSVYDSRLDTAENLSTSRREFGEPTPVTRRVAFARGVKGVPNKHSNWQRENVNNLSEIGRLKYFESVEPFSLKEVDNPHKRLYYCGLFSRLLFSLYAEKALYMFMVAIIATKYSLGGWLSNCWVDQPLFGIDYHVKDDLRASTWYVDHLSCTWKLRALAVLLAWLILVSVEMLFLSWRRATVLDKIADGALRITFHCIDAYLMLNLFVIRGIDFSGHATEIDVTYYLTVLVQIVHLLWNAVCVFYLKDPTRCFSFVEAFVMGVQAVAHFDDVCLEDMGIKTNPVQDEYKPVFGDAMCKLKSSVHMFWGLRGVIPTVFSNCSHNEKIAMDGRVGKLLPAHRDVGTMGAVIGNWKKLQKVTSRLMDLIPSLDTPMNFYEWAATFPPGRRRELLRTREDCHDMPPLGAASFIKREIAPKDLADPVFKDPRFIQGCPLELSAAVGPSLRAWTKQIVGAIGPEGFTAAEVLDGKHIIYTCGRSNEEIGHCFRRAINCIDELSGPEDEIVFLEDDQSRFDLHMTEGPFKYLQSVYRARLPRRVYKLLTRGKSFGRTSLGTKYTIPYTMQSGWPDTSVGDTLVNAAMKTAIHGTGRPWISIICGDDSVTVTTRSEIRRLGGLDSIIDMYASFGMEVEAKLSSDPLDVEFCSGRFFPVDDTYVLFPKIGRLLSKIGCDMVARKPDDQIAWMRGITSTLEFYGKVDPLCRAISSGFRSQLGNGREIKDQVWEGSRRMEGSMTSTQHDYLMYYDHHYGLNAAQVRDLIKLLSRQQFGEMCHSSVLTEMALHDIA